MNQKIQKQSYCNKSSLVSSVQGRFTPDFRVDSQRSKSFDKHQDQSTSRRILNTPNFSKRENLEEFSDQQTTFGNEKKLLIPKLPLDTLLEEDSVSLNLSTICLETAENFKKPTNENNELLQLLECPEDWEESSAKDRKKKYSCLDESSIVDSHCRVLISNKNLQNVPPVNEMLRKQAQKYDKALILLQAHFVTYKDQADKQIIALTQELAEAKALIKEQNFERDSLVCGFKERLKEVKRELESQFRSHLNALERKLNEKEKFKRESNQERIQQLRKDFEKKACDSARESRSRSNSKGYTFLVEENKKLREDLTNLWKDTDIIAHKLGKK
jgi:hypothetical protein